MQSHSTASDRHQRRNDAQLAAYRRDYPAAWQQILDTMSEAERAEAIARADAAELDAFTIAWDRRAEALASVAAALQGDGALIVSVCPRCQQPISKGGTCGCPRTTPHVTAQMIRDVWADENGPQRVAELLRALPEADRNRAAVDYWNLLRQRGHSASLVETHIQFELTMLHAA